MFADCNGAPFSAPSRTSMDSNFSAETKSRLRREYGCICSVCLTVQTTTGSQCAHLFPKADYGQDMVDEATSLGMLDSRKYDRDSFENGTIQCGTCHLGYFTRGFLVFSPPMPVLEWIMEQLHSLEKKANVDSVWKIFCSLEEEKGPHFNRFHHLNTLIPRFPAANKSNVEAAEWYDIYCNLPLLHTIDEDGKFAPSSSRRSHRGVPRFRIFDFYETLQGKNLNSRRVDGLRPGVIRLFPTGTVDTGPVNYWRLPVPCYVMLFVFIDAVERFKFDSSFLEVALARRIYRRLKKIRDANSKAENGAGGLMRGPRMPCSSPKHHRDCRHPMKGNAPKYCAHCWTLSPSNFPPMGPLPTDVSDSEDRTPSRTRTGDGRRRIPALSFTSAKAYLTPSSLPKPERESDLDYFSVTSGIAGISESAFNPPTAKRSVKLGGSSTHASQSSVYSTDGSFPAESSSGSTSDEDSEYLPAESGTSDADENSDSSSEAQESSEEALEELFDGLEI
ncbi:hypothetical protein C8R44DRAFT_991150 [Mycena epipterygia]|nr:hypothetical protein C8R44DRAFT_991150 [Mycena epipterygia]